MNNEAELWKPKVRIEQTFRKRLRELARRIIKRIGAAESVEAIQQALLYIASTKSFQRFAESAAMKMVTGLFADQGRTWRQAAFANGRGRQILQALQRELKGQTGRILAREIANSTYYIKSIPTDLADAVSKYAAREAMKGRRYEEIAREIRHLMPEHTMAKVELIARTQVSITQSNLIKARAEQFGWNWYVWNAVGGSRGDGRTRHSHKEMAGVLINWSDPPAPEDLFPLYTEEGRPYKNTLGHYHAGCCPNCRCVPTPIVDIRELDGRWPMRIYMNGSISRINRAEFQKLSGVK